jgi:hypothetical protein
MAELLKKLQLITSRNHLIQEVILDLSKYLVSGCRFNMGHCVRLVRTAARREKLVNIL